MVTRLPSYIKQKRRVLNLTLGFIYSCGIKGLFCCQTDSNHFPEL